MHAHIGGSIDLLTRVTEIEATTMHVAGKLHELVDGVVDCLNTIGIVDSKFWIVRCLDFLGNDTIPNAKSVKDKLSAVRCAVGDHFVLFVEIVVE